MIPCNQEGRISAMETVVNRIDKTVNGNGQKGMVEITLRLDESVKQLHETIQDLRIAVSGFTKFQAEAEAEAKKNERQRVNKRWMIGTIITLSLGIAGLLADKIL